MKNETLTISGVLFNYIFDASQGKWCWTRKKTQIGRYHLKAYWIHGRILGQELIKANAWITVDNIHFQHDPHEVIFPWLGFVWEFLPLYPISEIWFISYFSEETLKRTKKVSGTQNIESRSISTASLSCRCFIWF